MQKMAKVRSLINIAIGCIVFCTHTCFTVPARASERIIPETNTTLSPKAREAAIILGILPKVERLLQIKQAKISQGLDNLTDEELELKVTVLDKVLGASLEIRMVSGVIDRELAWSYAGHDMLLSKRQRNLNYLFTANFMQGGILGVLSGPAFLHNKPVLGTELLLLASSIGLGLSTLALVESRRGSKRVDGGTTILADVFSLERPSPPEHKADIVSKYLHAVPPEATNNKTRIEQLIATWEKGHYLRSTKESHLQKLSAIEPEGKKYRETPRLLDNRIRMLFDTQYTIELFHEELLDLLRVAELS